MNGTESADQEELFTNTHDTLRDDTPEHEDKMKEESSDEEAVDYVPYDYVSDADSTGDDVADAPLSSMLDAELRDIDPRQYFPDFRKNRTLRFSRVFGHSRKGNLPQIWRGAKSSRRRLTRTESVVSQAETERGEFQLDLGPTPPPEDCQTDDELHLIRPQDTSERESAQTSANVSAPASNVAPWRYGPAQYWYDMMGVSETGEGFDYGIKLDPNAPITTDKILAERNKFPADAFLPFNLVHWEDNVIYDGEDVRQSVVDQLSTGKQPLCGWIPTQHTRTYESFMVTLKNGGFAQMFGRGSQPPPRPTNANPSEIAKEPGPTHSIFPLDNQEFRNTRWEDDIIWDSEAMDHIPEPKVLTLDLFDDPKLFGLPEDKNKEDPSDDRAEDGSSPSKHYDRKEHQFTKKSQLILGLVQRRRKQEEEELESSMATMSDKDPFNISNDEYYLPKGTSRQISTLGASLIQHSMPAQNIMRPFFPTSWTPYKLRHFHRQPLKRGRGTMSKPVYQTVHSLTKHIRQKKQQREKQREEQGGGEIFFMREPEDLSAKDGDLVLCEYSEEHPPLTQQAGMASKIKNYYKRKPGKENGPEFKYGETAFTHTSPFLGVLAPGESLQSLENNLFRCPIYQHKPSQTDFLIIRTKYGYFLRTLPEIFCAGQICPLMEVPSPNSKRATTFVRDFLLAFIYRLFWASNDTPRRIRMEDIKNAFPHYAESSVRKRLKQCSHFKRMGQGNDQNFWVLREEFRLPSKEEVQAMITPEMCCAQNSMLAAEQRLKDAGYGEKYFFTPEEDDDNDREVTMEDEIKCAPWNTTRAYISAVKGKCLLDQTGIADPTGCGEGFSYVRVSARPPKEDQPAVPKRLVTGTDADLRKLPLKDAKQMLRDFGVKEEEINSLTRWEIIDVIRTLSTQQAKSKSDFTGIARFARGNIRFSLAELQEKYKRECQRIFELQNRTLSSTEVLSSDEESSGEDSDIEEMGKNIESMLSGKKNERNLAADVEEKERLELQKMLRGEVAPKGEDAKKDKKLADKEGEEAVGGGRKLKISRTFKTADGQEFEKCEVVTRPQLIDAYLKIRKTRDDAFIKHFAQMDEQYKEEKRKEKRRLQDQLRRIRRNEQKVKQGLPIGRPVPKQPSPPKPPPPIKPHLLKMKCSACGGFGHMRTNKHCPLYGKEKKLPPVQVALTDEQIQEQFEVPAGQLISVEGTKLKMSRALVEQAEKMKRRALKLNIPRSVIRQNAVAQVLPKGHGAKLQMSRPTKRKQTATGAAPSSSDYFSGPKQTVQRRRADPKVTFSVQLDLIIREVRNLPGAAQFLQPVNKKLVTDYYKIVQQPMDLQMIKMNISNNVYERREAFLADVSQIVHNSRLYNGDASEITKAARQVLELASLRVAEREQKLMRLEKAINPLLDDDEVVGFSFILLGAVQACKNLPKSYAFHQAVDPKKVKTYYDKVKNPMDLGTIEQKLKKHKYTSVEMFLKDVEQIFRNSEIFNGPMSIYTHKAREIWDVAKKFVNQNQTQLTEYEKNIQKALEAAEMESEITGVSSVADEGERMDSPVGEGDETIPYQDNNDWNDAEEGQLLDEDLNLSGDDDDQDSSGVPVDFSQLQAELAQQREGDSSFEQSFMDTSAGADNSSLGEDLDLYDPSSELLASSMHRSGQLNADLALSDSDDDLEEVEGKRPRMDDLDLDDL